MLNFILGTAGTGKTSEIIKEIGSVIDKKEKAILLVPEQFSFESERRIYREFGPQSSLYVEVLSFTRLCNSIFREFGGLAGIPVTETARYVLMSVTVNELQDKLQVYRKSAQNISFLDTLLSACSEFKTAGITPIALEEFITEVDNPKLKEKLEDISLVYTAYQALLENGYADPEDDLVRACEVLENNNFFSDYHVFIDGFTTFMAGEFEFLDHVIAQAKAVTIALTTDTLTDKQNGTGVFSVVRQAGNRLIKAAEQKNTPVSQPLYLEKPIRYKNEEIEVLSKNFLQNTQLKYEKETENVEIYKATDMYHEVQYIAAKIKNLVREKGYRYNEIAVIGRDLSGYNRTLELLFSKYDIPLFYDKRIDVETSPLVFGLLSALEAIQSNFYGETMLLLAKSPIMGLEIEETAMLENYCYSWQVRGQLWQTNFANNPRGLVEEFSERDLENLECINSTRKKVIEPLLSLKEAVNMGSAKAFAVGVYKFLEEIDAANNLREYSNQLLPPEKEEFLALSSQLWDTIMDILDVFGEVIGNVNLTTQRLVELFRLVVSSTDMGVLPQTLDQVLVGEADRIRPGQKKAIFVMGVNEEVFPANVAESGVFSENERKSLIDIGLEISGSAFQQALLEQFFGYFSFALPSDKLFISWSGSDLKGKEMLPSIFISQIENLFPHIKNTAPDALELIESEQSALSMLGEKFREDTPFRATLWQYFEDQNSGVVKNMETAFLQPPYQIENREYSKALFGQNMNLSPSRVERFHRCAFAYFVQDGLKLQKRRKVEFSPLESGSLIHHVLQIMMQKYGGKGLAELSDKQLEKEVSDIITEYLESRVEDMDTVTTRFTHLFSRLCSTLTRLLKHLGKEFMQSLYVPAEFELKINRDEGVKPLQLKTPDGNLITVEGIVDRVDVMEKNGKKYIRVVDYKSGAKSFRLHDVLHGLNLQMLLYLFTIQEHGTGELEGGIPAGVLYMPIRESYLSVERNTDAESAEKELQKQWSMSGILLDDEDTLRGMEEELSGVFIPAKLTKSGKLDARSSLASNEEMGRLSEKIKEEILLMAQELSSGKIPAYPINTNDYPTCSYCDYREVCGYEDGDPIRTIEKISNKEVMEILEKEEQDV